jgi:hypothetical protein
MVFEGGGILGISYLGVLDYLYRSGHISSLQRIAGTSAGAITACITSFNLPFEQIEGIASSLDYKKIPERTEISELQLIPEDMYIVGTDLSMKTARVFSFETTPAMEVATAVRISMSIPLFFEAVKMEKEDAGGNSSNNIFCDGGLLNNYPLNLFDSPRFNTDPYYGANMETLGVRFAQQLNYKEIDCLLTYIESLLHAASYVQQGIYDSNILNKKRSIVVDTRSISPVDFNVTANDEKYWFLYMQGYRAAKKYFEISTARQTGGLLYPYKGLLPASA